RRASDRGARPRGGGARGAPGAAGVPPGATGRAVLAGITPDLVRPDAVDPGNAGFPGGPVAPGAVAGPGRGGRADALPFVLDFAGLARVRGRGDEAAALHPAAVPADRPAHGARRVGVGP